MNAANNIAYFRLKNGTLATIRAARLEDAPLLWAMHKRLSATSIYKRYHRHYEPSLEALEHVCRINQNEGAVFVATIENPRETIIGMAYYLIEESRFEAEPAILVEDHYQGMGLGNRLAEMISHAAITQGISRFTAYVLYNNAAMLHMINQCGMARDSFFERGTAEIHIDLMHQC